MNLIHKASDTLRQTPLRPKRRLPRPQRPSFSAFRQGGLHFGRNTPHTHPPNGGIALHEAPTRRRHAARGLHVVQKPHPFPHVGHHVPSDTRPQCRYARKYSPNEAPPTALPRQSSPSKSKNTNFGVFSARWANFIAHWAQQRGDDATTATTAAADAGQRETAITTARP